MAVLMTWGPIAFGTSTAGFQMLRRATRFRVPTQQRIGNRPGYQFVGPGEDSVTLSGVLMLGYRGRASTLADLRALGDAGEAHSLTAGSGEDFGKWWLGEVSEERHRLFSDGAPRKIAFTARFVRDDEQPAGQVTAVQNRSSATGATSSVISAVEASVADGGTATDVVAAARGVAI